MAKRKHERADADTYVRVKLHIGGDAIGPGKIALLRNVEQYGGISAAARAMGISFRRAWHLIDTTNSALGEPVVETEVGGARGGGARLTPLGRELVSHYDSLAAHVAPATDTLLAWVTARRRHR